MNVYEFELILIIFFFIWIFNLISEMYFGKVVKKLFVEIKKKIFKVNF